MYRIRLASGEEAVYRTAEELAQAVSSGVVSATAEVFHNSAGRWLPINVHPDYRAVTTGKRPAVEPKASPAPAHPQTPSRTPALKLRPPVVLAPPPAAQSAIPVQVPLEFLPPTPLAPGPPVAALATSAPLPQAAPVGPTPAVEAEAPPEPAAAVPRHPDVTRTSRLRIMLALVMGLVGVSILSAGGYLVWPRVGPWLAAHRASAPTLSEGMPPVDSPGTSDSTAPAQPDPFARLASPATRRLDSIPTSYPAPSPPLAGPSPRRDSVARVGEGRSAETRVSRLTATRAAMPSYFEAYADARSEMDDGFDYVSFRRVFAPSRFAAPESLRAARRMVAAAGNILRVYRGREVMLEQSYRPDDPGGRGSLREPFETAEASRALLSDIDSLFGMLVSQQGRFTYAGEFLNFQDPRTARNYNALRAEIASTLRTWRDAGEATNRVTLPRLLRALGETSPPPAR